MKIVINNCYGGYSLSTKAAIKLAELKGVVLVPGLDKYGYTCLLNPDGSVNYKFTRFDNRVDLDLVAVVEILGSDANGDCAELKVIEVPDDVDWVLDEYDGIESVEESHRSWH